MVLRVEGLRAGCTENVTALSERSECWLWEDLPRTFRPIMEIRSVDTAPPWSVYLPATIVWSNQVMAVEVQSAAVFKDLTIYALMLGLDVLLTNEWLGCTGGG